MHKQIIQKKIIQKEIETLETKIQNLVLGNEFDTHFQIFKKHFKGINSLNDVYVKELLDKYHNRIEFIGFMIRRIKHATSVSKFLKIYQKRYSQCDISIITTEICKYYNNAENIIPMFGTTLCNDPKVVLIMIDNIGLKNTFLAFQKFEHLKQNIQTIAHGVMLIRTFNDINDVKFIMRYVNPSDISDISVRYINTCKEPDFQIINLFNELVLV